MIPDRIRGPHEFPESLLYYMACPYTDDSQEIMHERFALASEYAELLRHMGYLVYSPISESIPRTKYSRLRCGTTWDEWKDNDEAFIDHCDGLFVLCIDGWQRSVGVSAEIEYAKKTGKPVYLLRVMYESQEDFLCEFELI